MHTGNIIKNIRFLEHGWDVTLQIRAADEQAYQEAKQYIRDTLAGGAEKARLQFLEAVKERTGDVH